MQHNKTGHRNAGRSPAAPRRKLLNRKQAEYLATAIEKGLVVSAEELSRRVWSERCFSPHLPRALCADAYATAAIYSQCVSVSVSPSPCLTVALTRAVCACVWCRQIAKEREDRSNRHAACIGSLYSSTWPSGGERLRTQGEHAAVRRQQKQGEEERERKESAKSPQLSPMSSPRRSIVSYDLLLKQLSPKALTSPEPTQPAFIGQFSTKNARGTTPDIFPPPKQLSEYSLSLAGARSLTSVRIRKEGLMDQEPWKRVNKPRALTVQEQARVKVYCSQCHLFSGLQLQDGGVAIRPLHQLDLLQVVDGFKADADALARQRIQTKSEKTRDNANLANVKLGSDAAPGTNESDASSANDWLQGLLDKPQNALELLEQLQEHDAAVVYSIVDVATGRSVGVMSLGDNAPQSLRIDIARIVLPRSLCTSTVMVQTLHLILEHIFEKIQYVRVQVN